MRSPFTWMEVEHWTGADLAETLQLLSDQDEADSFLSAYADVCDDDDHALHNIRYLAQYIASSADDEPSAEEDAKRICEFFGLDMPTQSETISPRQWFKASSLGVKAAA